MQQVAELADAVGEARAGTRVVAVAVEPGERDLEGLSGRSLLARAAAVDADDVSSALPGQEPVGMPSFLVETFVARGAAGERSRLEGRTSQAAEALTQEGTSVRFGGSIHVLPDEEICFFSFEAPSDRAATLVAERAGMKQSRVVEIDTSVASRWHSEAT